MKSTQEILKELYHLDPSLKTHEQSLKELVEEIQKRRPHVTWDKTFYQSLKAQIQNELPQTNPFSLMKKFAFALALLALVVAPTAYYLSKTPSPSQNLVATQFTSVGPNGFGDLNPSVISGYGGGGESNGVSDDYTIAYHYNYTGDTLPTLPETMDVIEPADYTEQQFNEFLASKGLTDWNHSGITNFDFNVSIQNPNGQRLCGTYMACNGEDPSTLLAFPENKILSDDEIFGIFNTFLSDHDLSTDSIGSFDKPYIDERSQEGGAVYNGLATLNYEFKVDGHVIYGLSGDPIIGAANIDMVNKEVLDFQSLTPENYLTSAYETADNDSILAATTHGGLDNSGLIEARKNPSQTIELNLGTPKLVYIQMTAHSNPNDPELSTKTYYVPAYLFPVLNPSDGSSSNVIVPVIQSMLSQLDQSF